MLFMITKRVQILEILYPKGIKKEQYEKIGRIFGLIDHLIDETKEPHPPISKPVKDVPVKTVTMKEAMGEAETPSTPSKPVDYFPVFIETTLKESPTFTKSQRVDYGDVYVLKQFLHYKIVNKDRTTVTAHLDYLQDYYNKLPEKFSRDDIQGLSRTKQSLLFKFYILNAKFKNTTEMIGNKKYIVKDI